MTRFGEFLAILAIVLWPFLESLLFSHPKANFTWYCAKIHWSTWASIKKIFCTFGHTEEVGICWDQSFFKQLNVIKYLTVNKYFLQNSIF